MPVQTPEALHRTFAELASTGAVDALADLYEPDATIVERSGELTTGEARIRQHLEGLVSARPSMHIERSFAFRNGDLALLCSRWTATADGPDGRPIDMEFRGSELARRQPDGSWRLVLDDPWGIELGVQAP